MKLIKLATVSEHFHPEQFGILCIRIEDSVEVSVPRLLFQNPGSILHQFCVLILGQEVSS